MNRSFARRPTLLFVPLLLAAAVTLSRPARAQVCPDPPDSQAARRNLAKDWFGRADASEVAGDLVAAVKAYACSMRMIPHAHTAYNLARVAEKAGDLELALEAYRKYLSLKPDAPDQAEIEGRIKGLEARIAAVRDEPPVRPALPAPGDQQATDRPSAPVAQAADEEKAPLFTERPKKSRLRIGPVGWGIAGGAAAALVAGIVLNLGARSKMDDCWDLAGRYELVAAQARCDAGKSNAYISYVLFGVAGAAIVADVVLVWRQSSKAEEKVALSLGPGGAVLTGSFRF